MGSHARLFPPSGAARWVLCPGSVRVEEAASGERRDSIYSFEGTVAHLVRELSLLDLCDLESMIGHTFISDEQEEVGADGEVEIKQFVVTVTEEMVDFLRSGIDRVRDLGEPLFVEYRVDISFLIPGCFGTLDVGHVNQREFLVIINDLKFGRGIPVDAYNNYQLRLYAVGFWNNVAKNYFKPNEYRKVRFRLEIDQPRVAGGGDEWEVSYDDLMAYADEAQEAAENALGDSPRFNPGEKQCFWCAGARNLTCEHYARFVTDSVGMKFDQMEDEWEPPEMEFLTPERRAFLVRHDKMVKAFLTRVYEATLEDALAGRDAGGLKAVAGRRGNRRFTDDAAAEGILVESLGEDAFNKTLISAADADKKLRNKQPEAWDRLEEFIEQPDGKPILVEEDDPRPALRISDRFE